MAQPHQQRFGCYIGNIDRSVTLEVLRQVFSQCGTIVDCSLNGRDEDPYRYGFIDFASADDRLKAMKYNGFTLAGRKIKVGVSKGNVGRPEGYNSTPATANGGAPPAPTPTPAPAPPPPQHAAAPIPAAFIPAMIQQQQQQQQQQSTQLLLQLIQQGSIDVNNLTPDQQQALMASLLFQTAAAAPAAALPAGMPPMAPAAPMPFPPMHQPPQQHPPQQWPLPRGGFHALPHSGGGRGLPFPRGPANQMPSDEMIKLREVQRKQFLDVVRREAEAYEHKLQERRVKETREGSASASDDASTYEDERKSHPKNNLQGENNQEDQEAINNDDIENAIALHSSDLDDDDKKQMEETTDDRETI